MLISLLWTENKEEVEEEEREMKMDTWMSKRKMKTYNYVEFSIFPAIIYPVRAKNSADTDSL